MLITVKLTQDQVNEVHKMLCEKKEGLEYTVRKYTECPSPESAMTSNNYGSWNEFEYSRLPQTKQRLAFIKRLQTTLAQAKS